MPAGEIYGLFGDVSLFNQVQIDAEGRMFVWPNGADFDPETLHDWPRHADAFAARAREWEPGRHRAVHRTRWIPAHDSRRV